MSSPHLSYTAMTGRPVVRDYVTKAILSGRDLAVFANIGAFKEHHLRILVTMPRTPLYVIKMVAQEPGTRPERAIDYCSSSAMARVLINVCRDVTCFALYNQQEFVEGLTLHEDRKGSDRFRRAESVYEVLCERIMYGGDVLPSHVIKWFVDRGTCALCAYMTKRGSSHMIACYDVHERQEFDRTGELGAPSPYAFMVAYHRYTKYLPLTMFFRVVSEKRGEMETSVGRMADKGYTGDQIQISVQEVELKALADFKASDERKRKVRRFNRAMRSVSVKQLYGLSQKIFELGCCEQVIFAFL